MISLQDTVKYIGLAAVVYFLIKAFTDDKINNYETLILVLCIMAVVIFISYQNKCPIVKREGYQITDPPVVDSIYPGPLSNNRSRYELDANNCPILNKKPGTLTDTTCTDPVNPLTFKYVDKDIQDFKNIMGINKKTYQELIDNENRAKEKIRSKYRDEMVYTTTHPFNTVPLGTQLYGYTYLPPENWFRAYERPPVCVTDKRCPVCPLADSGTAGLMEFDTSNNVMGPAGIDLRYIKKVLNQNCS